jgi:hypothetical protein
MVRVSNAGRGKSFSLLQNVQARSRAHTVSYAMGTGHDIDHSTLHLWSRLRIGGAISLLLLSAFMPWTAKTFYFLYWNLILCFVDATCFCRRKINIVCSRNCSATGKFMQWRSFLGAISDKSQQSPLTEIINLKKSQLFIKFLFIWFSNLNFLI